MKIKEPRYTRPHLFAMAAAFLIMLASNSVSAFGDDSFIKGYAAAILEREFNVSAASLSVTQGGITIKADAMAGADRNRIISLLSGIDGVKHVAVPAPGQKINEAVLVSESPDPEILRENAASAKQSFFNKNKTLFAPLLADPRWPHFGMTYQRYTKGDFNKIFSASFGETLPIYMDKAPFDGLWQIAVQAGAYIIHDLGTSSWDLINQDYMGGLAFMYRRNALSGLFGIYHNSTHIGDEYIIHNNLSDGDRMNFSYEALQLKLSHDIGESYRVYSGVDYLFSPSPKDLKAWFVQYGMEFRSPRTFIKGVIRPIAGADFKHRQEHSWHGEVSLRAGLEYKNENPVMNKIDFMLEYYNGNSPNGQFHTDVIEYYGLGTHLYF